MIQGPPYELVYRYWPLYEDAFWRFRQLFGFFGTGARVTSWYRDPERNAAVGGAPHSQHLLALAVDAVVDPQLQEHFLDACRFLGLIPIVEGDHIHVQRYEAGLLPAYLFRGE